MSKKRLDHLILEQNPGLSRAYVQSLIMRGKVLVDRVQITKSGTAVAENVVIELLEQQRKFVSRAGIKLDAALSHFDIDVSGYVVLDCGISTGGFSDCLLQRGARRIYGVDVGYGQVHNKIRSDERVVLYERTNVRHLKGLPELVDLVTLDLSFISVLKVMPAVVNVLKPSGQLIILIKPQFEARRSDIARGGIVKDEAVHKEVVTTVCAGVEAAGFAMVGVIDSPIAGGDGNKEFLALFRRGVPCC